VLRAFLDADEAMRESPHPRVELEMATVRATRRPAPPALEELLKRVDEAAQRLRQGGGTSPAAPASTHASLLDDPRPTTTRPPAGRAESLPPRAPAAPPERVAAPPRPAATAPPAERETTAPPAELGVAWQRVVDEVNRKKPMLGGMLAQVVPGGLANGTLTIVLSGTGFHRDMLTDAANKELLTQLVRRHVAGAERVEIAMQAENDTGPSGHPAVRAAKEIFQGEVVAVRPRPPEGEGQ